MVRRNALGRFAFTMIELIFAIVIMSIAVMSLPMMIQTTSEGIEGNIVQEAIFAASAELMGATSYYWDLNSMQDASLSRLERVIDVGGNCDADRLRPGHINQPYHRRCLDSNATVVANTPDTNIPPVFPNLNNAVHVSEVIFTDSTTDATGYKNAYKSIVSISLIDGAGNVDNNIKKITSRVTNSDDENITVLSTYSANIGEIDYYKRRF